MDYQVASKISLPKGVEIQKRSSYGDQDKYRLYIGSVQVRQADPFQEYLKERYNLKRAALEMEAVNAEIQRVRKFISNYQ